MAMEPMTLFARIADPVGVARFLRQRFPATEFDGDDCNWRNGVIHFGARALTITHDPDYYAEPNWSTQLSGMRGYFSRFPESERKKIALILPTTFKISLGLLFDPDYDSNGDPRLDVAFAVANLLDGVFFTPSSFRDAHGRVLFGAGGEEEEDPEAVWPQVVAEVSIPTSGDAAERLNPDSASNSDAPLAQRVARRVLAMTAVTARAILEQKGVTVKPRSVHRGLFGFVKKLLSSREMERRELINWVEQVGIADELEPEEWEMLQRPVGRLEARQQINSTWRIEGLVVLAWALRRFTIPAHDKLTQVDPLFASLGILDVIAAKEFLANPSLRSRDEIGNLRGQLFALHWRLVNQRIHPGPINFIEFAQTCWFGPLDVTGLPLVDGDLSLGGKRIERALEETFSNASSIVVERHHAVNWLWEGPDRYSQTSVNT